ncbi:cytochrome P450 [Flagelloscypha sp. PMI_526]|nr:cytochrome P450 [Flagelloscypha sp. PMI_526]
MFRPNYVLSALVVFVTYIVVRFKLNPLRRLAGPPVRGLFGNHLKAVLDPAISPRAYEALVRRYGRSIRIRGLGPWDDRLLTLDPVSLSHVLKNSTIYEKPWQSRRLITSLIGEGMLAAEGQMHKRQRRVATPAFSIQNLRALVPIVFHKGAQLAERWKEMIEKSTRVEAKIDVCHWVSRATFDVIGLTGFDYDFNAIQDESNELFLAYKEMFEVSVSQGSVFRSMLSIHAPFISRLFPDESMRVVQRGQKVIERVAGNLIQEKKQKMLEAQQSGQPYTGKDLLSLLLRSNSAEDLSPSQRISDEDMLHNINTFMFAGSDTSSLTVTWALHLLATHPNVQTKLRQVLAEAAPRTSTISELSDDEIQSLWTVISTHPYLDNVTREVIRLIPPVHSSIRVATQEDEIPTSTPVHLADGSVDESRKTVTMPKGAFVHVPIEAFNLDKEVWGDDAWDFVPERWDSLPDRVTELPGLFSHTLTFSAGPRSCIGLRFSLIEIKTFLYILLSEFQFAPTPDKIIKSNVVLTRPYISGRYKEGSQLPLLITRI